jgi:endonuclease YncB( thermonuclease family)
MFAFGPAAGVFARERNPDLMRSGHDRCLGGMALTPMAWPQPLTWVGNEPPEVPNPCHMPPGVIATARPVMILPTREEGGNTVLCLMANQTRFRVRLFGVDVPAPPRHDPWGRRTVPGQPYGEEAVAYLQRLVQGRRVRIEIYGVDRARGLLGTLFCGTVNLNLALVEAGLAEVDRGPAVGDPYHLQYEAAESAAKHARRGMWGLSPCDESPPAYRC